jgi:GrpB-like predicted nucleotidyltransferase (UPF0157 family)
VVGDINARCFSDEFRSIPVMADHHTPIEIVGYREEWPERFAAERDRLRERIGDRVDAFEHVGSTSIPGLAAKPIVDICPAPPDMDAARDCKPAMLDLGYRFNAERENWLAFERLDDGQQYNVHFHPRGSSRLERVLVLRDYLRDHPHACRAYATVKRHAAAAHPDDTGAYNDAKDDIVECLVTAAREAGYEPAIDGS